MAEVWSLQTSHNLVETIEWRRMLISSRVDLLYLLTKDPFHFDSIHRWADTRALGTSAWRCTRSAVVSTNSDDTNRNRPILNNRLWSECFLVWSKIESKKHSIDSEPIDQLTSRWKYPCLREKQEKLIFFVHERKLIEHYRWRYSNPLNNWYINRQMVSLESKRCRPRMYSYRFIVINSKIRERTPVRLSLEDQRWRTINDDKFRLTK